MRPRIEAARFLIRFGRFIQSLALMVMRPDDVIEFTRQNYARSVNVDSWTNEDLLNEGLSEEESRLVEQLPPQRGRLLLLGLGGGREVLPLAQAGYDITGVDFIGEMVDRAVAYAARHGIAVNGIVGEVSALDLREGPYDVIWLSTALYSCIPTRVRRVALLHHLNGHLSPDGVLVCQFHWNDGNAFTRKIERIRKAVALLIFGNLWHERGDMLWGNNEFIHAFSFPDRIISEFYDGGFNVSYFHTSCAMMQGGAILKRRDGG